MSLRRGVGSGDVYALQGAPAARVAAIVLQYYSLAGGFPRRFRCGPFPVGLNPEEIEVLSD